MDTVIGKQQENLGAQNDFLEFYKNISPGYNQFSFEKEKLDLILIVGDISDIIKSFHAKIDAWYLDGFSPSKNPDMWTNEIFSFMKRNSKKGATFSTYSTAGFVREGLTNAGFKIEKSQGFGNKKNMLKGIIPVIQQTIEHKPWFRVPKFNSKNKSAIIIGGGLAGTSIAFALSEKNYKVTLIERENKISSGASGNPAGMFAPVLTGDISDLSKWSVASFNSFLNFLSMYGKNFPEIFRQIGVIQSVKSEEELRILEKSLKNYKINSDITITNNANQKFKGLFFSNAGWINPVQLSETYLKLAKHNLNLILSTSLIQIKNENTHWKVYLNNGDILETETLVIANSFDAKDFIQDLDKVKKVRGQILFFPSHEFPYPLENILLHEL
jgi:tRNA 5-methylaminomethyl-2-thiouridine biosynthesis bifunctional protein